MRPYPIHMYHTPYDKPQTIYTYDRSIAYIHWYNSFNIDSTLYSIAFNWANWVLLF